MTAEQTELIRSHVDVAVWAARKMFPFDDEYEGVALEALCKAARQWRPDGGANFRNYVVFIARGAMLDFHDGWAKTRTRRPLTKVPMTDEMRDVVVGEDRPTDTVVAEQIDNAALIDLFGPRTRRIADRMLAGATQEQVAAEMGLTGGRISQLLSAERRRLAHQRAPTVEAKRLGPPRVEHAA